MIFPFPFCTFELLRLVVDLWSFSVSVGINKQEKTPPSCAVELGG
jgi:hypothetical protein